MTISKMNILLLLLCLALVSCKQSTIEPNQIVLKQNWTDNKIREYFADCIAYKMYNGRYIKQKDSLNDFAVFSRNILYKKNAKNINNPLILALDEPYIDTANIDSSISWIRFTVNPCFRTPYCLIFEKKYNKTFITAKMTDGKGGYYSGLLFFSITNIKSDSLYNEISSKLRELNFWKLGQDTTCKVGCDGEMWTIEAIENQKYNIIERWTPYLCGNDITKKIAQIGKIIRDSSLMFEGYNIKFDKNIGKKDFDDTYCGR